MECKLTNNFVNSNRNYRFFAEIVRLSYAKDWEEAKKEWYEEEIYKVPHEEALTCICGHHPILNIIKMKNFTRVPTI